MILPALLLAVQAPSALSPAADPVAFDLRCMILASEQLGDSDPERANVARGVVAFFFGRLDGRLSEAQLEAGLGGGEALMRGIDRGALQRACGEFMVRRGEALTAIGRRIEARQRR